LRRRRSGGAWTRCSPAHSPPPCSPPRAARRQTRGHELEAHHSPVQPSATMSKSPHLHHILNLPRRWPPFPRRPRAAPPLPVRSQQCRACSLLYRRLLPRRMGHGARDLWRSEALHHRLPAAIFVAPRKAPSAAAPLSRCTPPAKRRKARSRGGRGGSVLQRPCLFACSGPAMRPSKRTHSSERTRSKTYGACSKNLAFSRVETSTFCCILMGSLLP